MYYLLLLIALIVLFSVFELLFKFFRLFPQKSFIVSARNVLLSSFSVLLIVSISALVGYGVARFEDHPYRVDDCVMPSWLYVEGQIKETGSIPSEEQFKVWRDKNFQNKNMNYTARQPRKADLIKWFGAKRGIWREGTDYMIGCFTGEGMQYYSSHNRSFFYDD